MSRPLAFLCAGTILCGLLPGCWRSHWRTDRLAEQDGLSESTVDRDGQQPVVTPTSSPHGAPRNLLDPDRAYEYLKSICALGPRFSGSPGMVNQQKLLTEHFEKLGAKVRRQEFTIRHPQNGQPVPITNLIVQWHPDRKERVLLAAHYDTRPWPDQDPNPRKRTTGTFVGANDGASGTALLMELAHFMPQLKGNYGVDFVLLDAEEFVFKDKNTFSPGDPYFVGSEYFARDYAANPPDYRYRWGVLVDMIGDRKLQIYQEKHSVWIPTCDIIDFDYPVGPGGKYWHTEADTPDKCSGVSLAKVGWVLLEWLESAK